MSKLVVAFIVGALGLGGVAFAEQAGGEQPSGMPSSLHCASGRQVMIRDLHSIQVENTPGGASIKLNARTPAEAQDVQRLARSMVDCISEGAAIKK